MDKKEEPIPQEPARTPMSDRVRSVVRGDAASLAEVVEWLTPLMRSWAQENLGTLAAVVDAEDVVQDVWVRTLPKLPGLEPRAAGITGRYTPALLGVVRRTLRNRVIDLRRQETRRRLQALPDETDSTKGLAHMESGPLSKLMRSERRGRVQRILQELPERDRIIYVKRIFEDASLDELAAEFGMSREAVIKCRQRVRRKLEAHLSRHFLDDLDARED